MIKYHLESSNPVSQFIEIKLHIPVRHLSLVRLQLPAWRAGRYQLANYVQNIRNLHVLSPNGVAISTSKITKDLWEFTPDHVGEYQVSYEYYCAKMDAGSCWVDDEQVYLNFVNCCFEVVDRSEERIQVEINFPSEFQSCTTLLKENNELFATNFQQLADSSFLASQNLTHESFEIEQVKFHLWFQGEIHFDLAEFKAYILEFAVKQIEAFGEFPVEEYHFIYQLLPYSHYHGVEHQRGTVITFGPAESLTERRSGYFTLAEYFETFEKVLNREAINFGWQNQSILESSFDLWIDGYVAGIPDKKVSIYTHGALIAFCLDIMLLDEKSSLHEVMKLLWKRYGKPKIGYMLDDVWEVILSQTSHPIYFNQFHEDYIAGKSDIFPVVENHLISLGFELGTKAKEDHLASHFGIIRHDGKVTKIHPSSEAYRKLMLGDLIQSQESTTEGIRLFLYRFSRKMEVELSNSDSLLFRDYFLQDKKDNAKRAAWIAG